MKFWQIVGFPIRCALFVVALSIFAPCWVLAKMIFPEMKSPLFLKWEIQSFLLGVE